MAKLPGGGAWVSTSCCMQAERRMEEINSAKCPVLMSRTVALARDDGNLLRRRGGRPILPGSADQARPDRAIGHRRVRRRARACRDGQDAGLNAPNAEWWNFPAWNLCRLAID